MVNVRRAQHLFFAFLGGGENVFFLIFCFSIGYEPQEKKKMRLCASARFSIL